MKVGVTGGTGFLGRYIVRRLSQAGHQCRCWYRPESDRGSFEDLPTAVEWLRGDLSDAKSMDALADGCDAVVHAALDRPGAGFRGAEGDLPTFVERNVLGTVRLIEAAKKRRARRFVFISTCAVHESILPDRKLDESHPMWPTSHYGAHKAALEEFVYSYGLGEGYDICALRPTGIYGAARPLERSRWYKLVQAVARGENISSDRGGKEVHASDVARAVEILLTTPGTDGQAYNCYDMYIAEQDVAEIAKTITGSASKIERLNKGPKNQIETGKIRALGVTFGGRPLLERTIRELLER